MKRINIMYGGIQYSLAGRDPDELQQQITAALTAGESFWLTVNDGEGTPREASLLITAGTDIALIPIPEPEQDEADTTDKPAPPPAR